MIRTLPRRVRHRLLTGTDGRDRGSLVLAMLVTLVATSVAALILPVLLTSVNRAHFDDRRAQQLAAAQTGVQTALARIRAAADTTSTGLIGALPCALSGKVPGSSTLRFKTDISYFTQDPALLSKAADVTAATAAATVQCVAGIGTAKVPNYVRIKGWGTDVAGSSWTGVAQRNVSATYVVKTTNSNIVGGLFRVNKLANTKDLCLDAGSATPTAGTPVRMRPCDGSLASQKWAYNATLTVSLVATRTTDASGAVTSDGLCVDGGSPAKEASGNQLRLQACGTTTNLTQQRWSMNDTAGMQGTDDGATLNSLCWAVASADTVDSPVVLGTQCAGTNGYDNVHSWQPEAAVGAGASGATYNELVNYNQFGRCLDVTNQNVGSSYLIAWPCKQQPDPTKVAWNQRWTLPTTTNNVGTGQISTTVNNTRYCLTSPLSAAAGKYVTVAACPTTTTQATTWTVRTKVASYTASYQIEDWSGGGTTPGLCLQPTDPTASSPDLASEGTGISKIVVAACSKTTLQKWNAPPNVDAPSIKDQTEN